MSRAPALYADPALYDMLHRAGTRGEAARLERLSDRHGNGGRSAWEPACGTGRYLAALAARGWTAAGYDSSRAMLAFARRRLARFGGRVRVVAGRMTGLRAPRCADLVFSLISTFRHLMSDRRALAHLRLCAEALRPGGIFVLGLDLTVYGATPPDEDVWTIRQGGRTFRHIVMTLPPKRAGRRERVINFVTGPSGLILRSGYDLRAYDAQQLSDLIAASPLRVEAVYGLSGLPQGLAGPERALWVVLKRRRGLVNKVE
ncbi:MAG: class I SAM-dependent methyltransferase [Elusimicrobia bacterium]|nr:class I SAM-dependent methyltransferase [Elusimicrobiota bacterium]